MSVLSHQVSIVSQELQEMTRLLRPLFHNPSALLTPSAVTPSPSVSPLSCSLALHLNTQHAPVHCPDDQNPPSSMMHEPPSPQLSMTKVFQGEFDPLSSSPSPHSPPFSHQTSTTPPVSHRSAPPSLNSSPHEHTIVPHPSSSTSIPSLSSSSHPLSITPLLVDLSEPQSRLRLHFPLQSHSESHLQSETHFMSQSYPHSLSQSDIQPQISLQTSSMASRSREPLLDLQRVEWGEHTTQLSLVDEGQSSM